MAMVISKTGEEKKGKETRREWWVCWEGRSDSFIEENMKVVWSQNFNYQYEIIVTDDTNMGGGRGGRRSKLPIFEVWG